MFLVFQSLALIWHQAYQQSIHGLFWGKWPCFLEYVSCISSVRSQWADRISRQDNTAWTMFSRKYPALAGISLWCSSLRQHLRYPKVEFMSSKRCIHVKQLRIVSLPRKDRMKSGTQHNFIASICMCDSQLIFKVLHPSVCVRSIRFSWSYIALRPWGAACHFTGRDWWALLIEHLWRNVRTRQHFFHLRPTAFLRSHTALLWVSEEK